MTIEQYLEERGLSYESIHQDENGDFYFSITDNGEVTDAGYNAKATKVYLPDNLQGQL
jgi:hypothetical protein